MPDIAIEWLIRVIEGKSKPRSDIGNVAIDVFGLNGKPSTLCTLSRMRWSSFSASECFNGCSVSKAHILETRFCATTFRSSVIGGLLTVRGNWKVSTNAEISWKRELGSLTLAQRNSSSSWMSGTSCSWINIGSTPLPIDTECILTESVSA